jgi:hypothetical protein
MTGEVAQVLFRKTTHQEGEAGKGPPTTLKKVRQEDGWSKTTQPSEENQEEESPTKRAERNRIIEEGRTTGGAEGEKSPKEVGNTLIETVQRGGVV